MKLARFLSSVFISVSVLALGLCEASNVASVYMTNGKASFLNGQIDKSAAAYGSYNDTMSTTGWGVLDVRAGFGKNTSNRDLMYAAGFLEGALTADRIVQHYHNLYYAILKDKPADFVGKVQTFFDQQEKWSRDMVAMDAGQTPLWRHVGYILAQMDGLFAGCKLVKTEKICTKFMIQALNGMGDLIDLTYVLDKTLRPDFDKMTDFQFTRFVQSHGHCSALIKITPGYENLYMSHSSWFVYGAMLRIYKHYDFNLLDSATKASGLSFSSYPGFLESLDDFYLLNSGLVMIQTTNNVFNHSLYDLVHPESLPSWVRVRAANHMAGAAPEWGEVLRQYNSGTYNNQYMVLDLSKIKLNTTIQDNALWVVEQIPTLVENHDQTQMLRSGHWPSYNVPFYETIFAKSGYPEMVKKRGLDNSYMLAPRAKIFRRDADDVSSMQDMKHIMRYNDYQHDKYSAGDPCKTICCRGDLEQVPLMDGCYDTKVSDYGMAIRRESFAVNGPSPSDNLKPFSWSDFASEGGHEGMPETFNFDFQLMKPASLESNDNEKAMGKSEL